MTPASPPDEKARHLRKLYRDNGGEQGRALVTAEHRRLFPNGEIGLDHILVDVWKDARREAGWTYRKGEQAWFKSDGSRVTEQDERGLLG